MRIFSNLSLVFLTMCFYYVTAQDNKTTIAEIKKEFRIINNDNRLKTIVLNNEEFLDHMPDGGGRLTGFYKKGELKKIVLWVGLSFGTETKEYYFKDDKLIFIYQQLNSFLYDEKNQRLLYDKTKRSFEGRYYFDNGKLINIIIKGHNKFEDDRVDPEQSLLKEAAYYGEVISKRKTSKR